MYISISFKRFFSNLYVSFNIHVVLSAPPRALQPPQFSARPFPGLFYMSLFIYIRLVWYWWHVCPNPNDMSVLIPAPSRAPQQLRPAARPTWQSNRCKLVAQGQHRWRAAPISSAAAMLLRHMYVPRYIGHKFANTHMCLCLLYICM